MARPAVNLLARAERAYAAVRVVSLDVAAAALGGGVMAVRVVAARPRPAFYALLPAAVWVVYTVDHLLDARRMGDAAATPRHRFHGRHAGPLWAAVAAVSVACAALGVGELSGPGVAFGGIVAGLFVAHEAIVKLAGSRASPLLVKEAGVAVVFTAGTWGLPALRHAAASAHPLDWPVLVAVQYGGLALVNLLAFSLYEADQDVAAGQTSFVRGVGPAAARRVAGLLLVAQIPAAAAVLARPTAATVAAEAVLLTMSVGLAALLAFPQAFRRRERYRTVGDGVFLLPLLMAFSATSG